MLKEMQLDRSVGGCETGLKCCCFVLSQVGTEADILRALVIFELHEAAADRKYYMTREKIDR